MIIATLYHTTGCHLCELAQELLQPFSDQGYIQLQTTDIADSNDLIERYGVRIPVLQLTDTGAELGWPFTAEQVHGFLQERGHHA